MSTLKNSLIMKQKTGKAPVFDDKSNSLETSINEESDEGSSNAVTPRKQDKLSGSSVHSKNSKRSTKSKRKVKKKVSNDVKNKEMKLRVANLSADKNKNSS